jgi:hypothetical protein
MSAITIVKTMRNSKRPRQEQIDNGKIPFSIRVREIQIEEEVEDRKGYMPRRGCRSYHHVALFDIRERRYCASFIRLTSRYDYSVNVNLYFISHVLAVVWLMNRYGRVVVYFYIIILLKGKLFYCCYDNESMARGVSVYA